MKRFTMLLLLVLLVGCADSAPLPRVTTVHVGGKMPRPGARMFYRGAWWSVVEVSDNCNFSCFAGGHYVKIRRDLEDDE